MLTTGSCLVMLAASMCILAMVSRNGAAEPVSQALELLHRGTTAERRHAVQVLAQIGDQRAVQPLAQALRDNDALVRETAELAGKAEGIEKAAVPTSADLLIVLGGG